MADDARKGFGSEKRRHRRTLVDAILRSAIIRPVGDDTEIWGMTVNQSDYGVQISVPIEISPKTEVEITLTKRDENNVWENRLYKGRVCWCNPDKVTEEAYNIGVEFLGDA